MHACRIATQPHNGRIEAQTQTERRRESEGTINLKSQTGRSWGSHAKSIFRCAALRVASVRRRTAMSVTSVASPPTASSEPMITLLLLLPEEGAAVVAGPSEACEKRMSRSGLPAKSYAAPSAAATWMGPESTRTHAWLGGTVSTRMLALSDETSAPCSVQVPSGLLAAKRAGLVRSRSMGSLKERVTVSSVLLPVTATSVGLVTSAAHALTVSMPEAGTGRPAGSVATPLSTATLTAGVCTMCMALSEYMSAGLSSSTAATTSGDADSRLAEVRRTVPPRPWMRTCCGTSEEPRMAALKVSVKRARSTSSSTRSSCGAGPLAALFTVATPMVLVTGTLVVVPGRRVVVEVVGLEPPQRPRR
eukprot:m.89118 g.89118  ORF g.89118 m.89118 type:complete len:362 (-) comp13642_c0_seq2:494-1579(-)